VVNVFDALTVTTHVSAMQFSDPASLDGMAGAGAQSVPFSSQLASQDSGLSAGMVTTPVRGGLAVGAQAVEWAFSSGSQSPFTADNPFAPSARAAGLSAQPASNAPLALSGSSQQDSFIRGLFFNDLAASPADALTPAAADDSTDGLGLVGSAADALFAADLPYGDAPRTAVAAVMGQWGQASPIPEQAALAGQGDNLDSTSEGEEDAGGSVTDAVFADWGA
jgi:hypothetical protein